MNIAPEFDDAARNERERRDLQQRVRELKEARAYYKTRYEKSADYASELERTIDELQQKLVDLHIRLQAERVELQARIDRAPRPPDYRRNELWTMELARRFNQWYNTDGPGKETER